MQAARLWIWTSAWRNAASKTIRRNYGGGHNLRPTTMNDMPVPKGDFWALYAKRQRGYNTVLAIGVISSGFGLSLYNTTDIVKFHFSPPATYE